MGILLEYLVRFPDFDLTQKVFCTFTDLPRRTRMRQSQNLTHLFADPFDRVKRGHGILGNQADAGAAPIACLPAR